jgi:tRNA(Ile)-lysidine synthase TilS/MesJ
MERYKEIERSLITTYRSKIWAKFIKAIKEYDLIQPDDKICVCISGGKDSMILAKCFQELKRHSDFEFEVKYLVMDPGYNPANLAKIKENLEILNIDAVIRNSDIFEVAAIQVKSPCYLCARMRRGCLYRLAEELGCNKIALGHHFDDVIETTLMNMLNAGSFQTMMPKLHSDNFNGMELIRPLYLVREKDIIAWKNYNNLSFLQCACRFTEAIHNDDEIYASKRKETKELIYKLEKENPNVVKNIFRSAYNVNLNMILGYKDMKGHHFFLDYYDELVKKDE